jgi:hypothetical protein
MLIQIPQLPFFVFTCTVVALVQDFHRHYRLHRRLDTASIALHLLRKFQAARQFPFDVETFEDVANGACADIDNVAPLEDQKIPEDVVAVAVVPPTLDVEAEAMVKGRPKVEAETMVKDLPKTEACPNLPSHHEATLPSVEVTLLPKKDTMRKEVMLPLTMV